MGYICFLASPLKTVLDIYFYMFIILPNVWSLHLHSSRIAVLARGSVRKKRTLNYHRQGLPDTSMLLSKEWRGSGTEGLNKDPTFLNHSHLLATPLWSCGAGRCRSTESDLKGERFRELSRTECLHTWDNSLSSYYIPALSWWAKGVRRTKQRRITHQPHLDETLPR